MSDEDQINRILYDLVPLDKDIRVLELAVKYPPKDIDDSEMEKVKSELQTFCVWREKAYAALKKLGVKDVQFTMSAYDKKFK